MAQREVRWKRSEKWNVFLQTDRGEIFTGREDDCTALITKKQMKELSGKLLSIVEMAEPHLRKISDRESAVPVLSGGWSRKQIIGHLIDSASNNHQRFVRAALQPSLDFPGYDQNGNIRVQFVQEAD